MLRPGSTERAWRTWRMAPVVAAAVLSGCGTLGGAGTVEPAAEGPSPAVIGRYDSAVAKLTAGDEVSAASEFERLASEHPDQAGPHFNLGVIRLRHGDETEAMTHFERASAVCTRCGPVWNEIGLILRHQGRFADAETAYRKAIELEPDFADAHFNLAVLNELFLQRPDLALDGYELYLQLAPESAGDGEVRKWVADLRRRVDAPAKAARADGAG